MGELGLNAKTKALGGKIGSRIGGGLRSAGPGLSFVDITGTVDADTDGIVFEGKPGLERPIIPRFVVPKELARKLSKLTMGDAEEIERQRRSGNSSIQFDENKLRSIIESLGEDSAQLDSLGRSSRSSATSRDVAEGPPIPQLKPSPYRETIDPPKRRAAGAPPPPPDPPDDPNKRSGMRSSTAVANESFSDVFESLDIANEDIDKIADSLLRVISADKEGKLDAIELSDGTGRTVSDFISDSKIVQFDDGFVSLAMSPIPAYAELIPGDRDWSTVQLPKKESLLEFIKAVVDEQKKAKAKPTLPGTRNSDGALRRSPLFGKKRKPEPYERVVGELAQTVIAADESRSVEDPSTAEQQISSATGLNLQDGNGFVQLMLSQAIGMPGDVTGLVGTEFYHDAIGHFGTGRGFDRHGEWANALAVITAIIHPDSKINASKEEKESFTQFWLREYAMREFEKVIDSTDELNDELESILKELPSSSIKLDDNNEIDVMGTIFALLFGSAKNMDEHIKLLDDASERDTRPRVMSMRSMSPRTARSLAISEATIKEERRADAAAGRRIPLGEIIETSEGPPGLTEAERRSRARQLGNHIVQRERLRGAISSKIKEDSPWVYYVSEKVAQDSRDLLDNLEKLLPFRDVDSTDDNSIIEGSALSGYVAHPDIGLSISDIIEQSYVQVDRNGVLSVRLPVNPILRGLIPGDSNYQEIRLPSRDVLSRAIEAAQSKRTKGQWAWLIRDLKNRKIYEEPKYYDAGDEEYRSLGVRAREMAEVLLGTLSSSLDDVPRNNSPMDRPPFGVSADWTVPYFYMMSNPHDFKDFFKQGAKPELILHDLLGHFANGNMYDRHSEWANALAVIDLVRNKNSWNELREKFPELQQFDDLDRDIFMRFMLAAYGSQWLTRGLTSTPVDNWGMPTEQEARSVPDLVPLFVEYDAPIDELLDILDPPGSRPTGRQGGSARSSRSISLDKAVKENPQGIIDSIAEVLVERYTDGPIDENLIRGELSKLEDDLDSGKITLPEYRRRQRELNSIIKAYKNDTSAPSEKTRAPKTEAPSTQKRNQLMQRGDGMIERDERGRPIKWDGQAFLNAQRDKQIERLRELGFSDDDIDILMGPSSKTQQGGTQSSRSSQMRLDLFDLFKERIQPERGTRRLPDLDQMSDAELRNALEVFDLRPPRKQSQTGIPLIPSWYPSRDQLVLELEERGYQVFKTPGTSRRHQDMIHVVAPDVDADDVALGRRINQPTSRLSAFITSKERETGQKLFSGGRIKDWQFIEDLTKLSDVDLQKLNLDFDSRRTQKVQERQKGVISNEEFNQWYDELTRLRRYLSDELTRRSLRAKISSRSRIEPKDDGSLTLASYVFLKQATPSLRSKRSFGPVVDSLIADGRINETTFNSLRQYHNIKDFQLGQLNLALRAGIGRDLSSDIDVNTLSSRDLEIARDIFNQHESKLANDLAKLDLGGFSSDELSEMGIDSSDIDDILDGKPLIAPSVIASSRSKNDRSRRKAKKDKKLRPNTKLTPEQVRISQEQKLRAKKIPGKRRQGPSISDWKDQRITSHRSTSSDEARNRASIYDGAIGRNHVALGSRVSLDDAFVNIALGDAVRRGDILPDGFSGSIRAQGEPRYKVLAVASRDGLSRLISVQDLRDGGFSAMVLHRDQPIVNAIRPSKAPMSMRSSRVGIPSVRNRVNRLYEQGDDAGIIDYLDGLLSDRRSIDDQISLIDSRLTDDGLSEVDEQRSVDLEEMSSGIFAELQEIVASLTAIGQQSLDFQLSREAIKQAESIVGRYSSYDQYRATLGGGLATVDWPKVVSVVNGQMGALEATTIFKNNERVSRLLQAVNTKLREFEDISDIDEIDIYDLDLEFDAHSRAIRKQADSIITHAITSVARADDIDKSQNTIIDATSREITPDAIVALNPSSRSIQGGTGAVLPTGQGLAPSRRIYPGNYKFAKNNLSFINYDGNLRELVVGLGDGSTTRFGGVDEITLARFIDPKNNGTAALNEIDKISSYVVRSSGSSRGSVPSFSRLLRRDLNRVSLSEKDREVVDAFIAAFDQNSTEGIDKIPVETIHDFVDRLFRTGETAMAVNMLDAVSGARSIDNRKTSLAPLRNTYVSAPLLDLKIILRPDEVGDIREEISDLKKLYGRNQKISTALSVYDDVLRKAQAVGTNPQISVTPAEYASIIQGYADIAMLASPSRRSLIGRGPLELAALSLRQEFDSIQSWPSSFSRESGPINNGAPLTFSKQQMDSLISWADSNRNSSTIRELADAPQSISKWSGLDALKSFWPVAPRGSQNSSTYSSFDDGGHGISLMSAKTDNYDSLKPIDKLIWLKANIASRDNKKGVRLSDVIAESRKLLDVIKKADANIVRYQDAQDFINSRGLGIGTFSRLDSLSPRTRQILSDASSNMFNSSFDELNPAQVLRLIRSLSSAQGSNKFGNIAESDRSLILDGVIGPNDDLISAVRARSVEPRPDLNISLPNPGRQSAPTTVPQPRRRTGIPLSDLPTTEDRTIRSGRRAPLVRETAKIPAVETYLAASSSRSSRSSSRGKEGRAEIRAEATKFKQLFDMLQREASRAEDTRTKAALQNLHEIMKRQKSAVISDRRTNAGALFLTQAELDEIIEALYVAMDRQIDRGSEDRTQIFAEFTELMARAAMATFVDGTVEPINSRTVKRMNQQGVEVEISLYE